MKNVILRTKRRLGKRLFLGTKMIKSKIILKRQTLDERLGIAIAVENDENNGRVLCVRIEQVEEGSAAQRSGLLPGDAIIRIDGRSVNSCTRIECLRLFADAKLLTELVILPVEIMEAIEKIGGANEDGIYKNMQNDVNMKKPARGNSRMDRLHRQESFQQQQQQSSSSSSFSSTNLLTSSITPSLIFNEDENNDNKNSTEQQQPPVARERKSRKFQAGSSACSISFYSSFSYDDDGIDEKRNQNCEKSDVLRESHTGRRPFNVDSAVNNITTEAINSGGKGRQLEQFRSGQKGREEEKEEIGKESTSNFKSNEGDFDDEQQQFPIGGRRGGGELWSDSTATIHCLSYQPQQGCCSDNIINSDSSASTQIFHQKTIINQMSQSNNSSNVSSDDTKPATLSSTNFSSREQQQNNNKFVSSRQPPQPKNRRRASHFATTSNSFNESRERNISEEQKQAFLLQQEQKQQNLGNLDNSQRRNTTSNLAIPTKTTTKERVGVLIKQFNALDKGELPIPNVLQPQTLSKSTSVRNLSLSPSIRCINRQTTSILSDDNREEGQSPSLSLDSDFLLREKNSTTASSVENDEVQSQTTDCTSNSIANASTHLPIEGGGGTGALLDLSRFKTEKVIGRTVPCFPHSSDSDCECDDTASNNRQTKKTLLSSEKQQQQSLFLSSLTSAQLQSTLNSLNSSSLISSASSPSPKLSSLIIPENNKKEEKSQQIISTKLEENSRKKSSLPSPPTNNFCLSTTFKEENLANISISDKTLTEDINIKVELSTRQNLSLFLASSSSPSPPLLVKDGSLDSQQQLKPSEYELSTIRGLLSLDEYSKTHLFCVLLHRPVGLDEVSVGLLLSERPLVRSTPERNSLNYAIEISKVTCGSIAEKNGYLMQGDRVFFIQHESTENMRVKEARTLLRSRAPSVHLIVGRRQGLLYQQQHNITNCLTNSSTSGSRTALSASSTSSLTALSEYQEDHQSSIFLTDPALERYAPDSILVTLPKSELIMGLSLDGGLSSRFGDRPIFVKRVFAAGEAALEGRISPGDEIRRIDSTNLNNFTRFEALKLIRGLTDGPVQLEVYKRIC